MKLLCLDRGIGFSFKQHLLKYYKKNSDDLKIAEENGDDLLKQELKRNDFGDDELFTSMDLQFVAVSEPTSSSGNYEEDELFMESIALIEKSIKEYQPNVLLCSSRGGKYIGKLMKDSIWRGPVVLISGLIVPSMMDLDYCESAIFAYGSEEKTVPRPIIENVKAFPSNKIVLLSYENEDHHMSALIQLDLMLKDWMNTAIENVAQLVAEYKNASDDSIFENKKLSLLELIVLSLYISNIEKRNIVKKSLPGSSSNTSVRSNIGHMLNPSMLKGGLGGLRKVQKE